MVWTAELLAMWVGWCVGDVSRMVVGCTARYVGWLHLCYYSAMSVTTVVEGKLIEHPSHHVFSWGYKREWINWSF